MTEEHHDPLQCVMQLRQTLSADKLSIGFFLGAGCPCAVRISSGDGDAPIIPDIKGLTARVDTLLLADEACEPSYQKLKTTFSEDTVESPTIEEILNRIRAFRDVAGKASVRDLSFAELNHLDRHICRSIRTIVTCALPKERTPYHALASFIGSHRSPFTEIFTTNYDVLIEQALESERVPYFDGFVGSSRPFFDQRSIEDGDIPSRWSRLWKLHGSINWGFGKETKVVFRSEHVEDGDELLIHPSHLKYDESRRMPYFVMIDRLRSFLRRSGRPVALVLSGYSFGDEHINEAIVDSLKANASAACFALQFGNLANYGKATALARENANLSVLAADRAVIRRREGPWMASPTIDPGALKGTFELISGAASSPTDSAASEELRPCRMSLGEFKRLGAFLDEFSSYRLPVQSGFTE